MLKTRIEIEDKAGLFVWRLSGKLSLDALKAAYVERVEHPGWRPHLQALTVLERADLSGVSLEDIGELQSFVLDAFHARGLHGRARHAIVCDDALSQALMTFWDAAARAKFLGPQQFFSQEAAARAWLAEADRGGYRARMRSEYAFHDAEGLWIWRLGGEATLEGLSEAYIERFAHPGWRPGLKALTILDGFSLGDMSPARVDEFIAFIRGEHERRKVKGAVRAALVCIDPQSRAMLSYWEARTQNGLFGQERFFETEAEARLWLDEIEIQREQIRSEIDGLVSDIHVDEDRNRVVWRMSGRFSNAALLAAYEDLPRLTGWRTDSDTLVVFERIDMADVTPQDFFDLVGQLVEADARLRDDQPGRSAIVCADRSAKAILTYYEEVARDRLVTEDRLFEAEKAALTWLDEAR